jgi:hypothetical protein
MDASTFVQAPHAPAPELVNIGGPVITAPRFVTLTFPGETMGDSIATFADALPRTPFLNGVLAEYGVGGITKGPVVALSEPLSPGTMDLGDLEDAVRGAIASGEAPAPDRSTIYVVHLPPDVAVSRGNAVTCDTLYGFHEAFSMGGSGGDEMLVPYAVIPNCPAGRIPGSSTTLDAMTGLFFHELVETATDPFWDSRPAYLELDGAHLAWASPLHQEIGDLCERAPLLPLDGTPFKVQRLWSNAAARAGHDPCVPAPAGAFFDAAPALPDAVDFFADGGWRHGVQGVQMTVGDVRVIDVSLFSDAPVGAWHIAASELPAPTGAPTLDLSLDREEGGNGDHAKLTIKALRKPREGGARFEIVSWRNGAEHNWVGWVSISE